MVLGSATPDINTYYKAKELGKIELLELTRRANNSSLPEVEVVDLKQELANGNRSMFSRSLYQEIEKKLRTKETNNSISKQKRIFNIYNVQRMWVYCKMQEL